MSLRVHECVCELCVNVWLFLEGVDGTQGSRRSLAFLFLKAIVKPREPSPDVLGRPRELGGSVGPRCLLREVRGLSHPTESLKAILY